MKFMCARIIIPRALVCLLFKAMKFSAKAKGPAVTSDSCTLP